MTFLPILERELRVRARRPGTYWSRCAVALVGALICLPQLLSYNPFTAASTTGSTVFKGIVSGAFLLCCGACLTTAEAVEAEKREGTLGLLLLTRVRPMDVLLGKLGSVGLASLCLLVAFLPVLMLTVLAGGVTGGEAFRKGLALLNTLFFSLSLGFCGAASDRGRIKSVSLVVLLMLAFLLLPLLERWLNSPPGFLGFASPLGAMLFAGDASRQSLFWLALATTNALGWLLLFLAARRLARAAREEAGGAGTGLARLFQGNATIRRQSPRLSDEIEPVEWLVHRQRGVKAAIWSAVLLTVVYHISMTWYPLVGRGPYYSLWTMQIFGLATSLIGGGLLAWAASRFFIEARRSGALELLLTTPAGARSLVLGQWSAWLGLLRLPALVLLAPMLLRSLFGPVLWRSPGFTVAWRGYDAASVGLNILTTLASLGAIGWVSLWFGLKARDQFRAILWPVVLTKVVPYFVWVFGLALLSPIVLRPFLGISANYYYLTSWVPQIATLLFYLWLMRWARWRLNLELAGQGPAEATEVAGSVTGNELGMAG